MSTCTRRTVGWRLRDTLYGEIAATALKMSIERQKPRWASSTPSTRHPERRRDAEMKCKAA